MEKRIKEFYEYYKLAGLKERTLYNYCIYLNQFLSWLGENKIQETSVRKTDVLDFRNDMLQKGKYSNVTINHKLIVIKLYYSYLSGIDKVVENPVKGKVSLKSKRSLIRNILDIDQMGRFLSGITLDNPFDYLFRCVCEIMYSSGIRISECLGLKETDIDWDKGFLTVYEAKQERKRSVPIGEVALRWVDEYIKKARVSLVSKEDYQKGNLFPSKKFMPKRINKRIVNECKDRGFPRISSHCFRHSCATHLLKKGANIKQVQEFLGHKRIRTTSVYTHIMKDDLKKTVKAFHPRGES